MANENFGNGNKDQQSGGQSGQQQNGDQLYRDDDQQMGSAQDRQGSEMFGQQGDQGDSLIEGNEIMSDERENGQAGMGTMGQGGMGTSREHRSDEDFGENGE